MHNQLNRNGWKYLTSSLIMFTLLLALIGSYVSVAYAKEEEPTVKKWNAIIIDGVKYSQEDFLKKFDNKESTLHFYVDQQTERENVFYGFTSQVGLEKFLAKSRNVQMNLDLKNLKRLEELESPEEEGNGVNGLCNTSYSYAKFYEHINCEGKLRLLRYGYRVDLRGNVWNDEISSLTTPENFGITCVWQHSDYRGNSLCFWSGAMVYNLRDFSLGWFNNWNDEISSMAAFGLY